MANQPAGKAPSDSPALKPYRGKPAVRNFRGGNGNVGIIRSPVRAIALPDCRFITPNLVGSPVRPAGATYLETTSERTTFQAQPSFPRRFRGLNWQRFPLHEWTLTSSARPASSPPPSAAGSQPNPSPRRRNAGRRAPHRSRWPRSAVSAIGERKRNNAAGSAA